MIDEAKSIWATLELRVPMFLQNIEPLSDEQMLWLPGEGRKTAAWQLWHIAEVEENWVAEVILDPAEPARFPFGHRLAEVEHDLSKYPPKDELLAYFREVRALTRDRLGRQNEADFAREVSDPDFGPREAREYWAGVTTSFAWHAGQLALTAKLIPGSPVTVQRMKYLNNPEA